MNKGLSKRVVKIELHYDDGTKDVVHAKPAFLSDEEAKKEREVLEKIKALLRLSVKKKTGRYQKLKNRFADDPEKEKRMRELIEVMAKKNKIRASVLYGSR